MWTASRTGLRERSSDSTLPTAITTTAGQTPHRNSVAKMKAVDSRMPSGCCRVASDDRQIDVLLQRAVSVPGDAAAGATVCVRAGEHVMAGGREVRADCSGIAGG